MVSITPYGQAGPRAQWKASDINLQGMGGHLLLSGDIERAPVRVSIPASCWHAGGEGAMAALIAHRHRQKTGVGQHVDVSIQQCMIWTLLNTTMTWQLVAREETRGGARRKERGNRHFSSVVWPCADGLVFFIPIGGGGGMSQQRSWLRLVEWMQQEGHGHPVLLSKDWNNKDMHAFTQVEYDEVVAVVAKFLRTKTVKELYGAAIERKLLLAPIASVKEVFESQQLRAREFFVEVRHPEIAQAIIYPGAFAKFSETPLKLDRRAPRLGEHNADILERLAGLSEADLISLANSGVI